MTYEPRVEQYDRTAPDGTVHTIRRNLDTGEQSTIATRPGPPPPHDGVGVPIDNGRPRQTWPTDADWAKQVAEKG